MNLLRQAIAEGSFLLDVRADDWESLFRQTLNHVVAQGLISTDKRDEAEAVMLARERQAPTALGLETAVPHAYLDIIEQPLLRNIPMAVLYGLFLLMGIVSISGNQFFERLNLWFTDSARYPLTPYRGRSRD